MKNNKLARCYQCYYSIWVHPTKDGRAMISTCCNNMFRAENRVIAVNNIKKTWNSRQFKFQRKLKLKKDWSSCKGASCENRPFAQQLIDENVNNAIKKGNTELEYLPRMVTIIPSEGCNNNCYFCYQAPARKKCENYRLRNNLIQELKDDIIPHAAWVVISGGEPFFSIEGLDLINWTLSCYPEKKLCVLTNGTLLDKFGLERIMRNNISLRITFYGMSKLTYSEVTKTDNFNAMFNNVKGLIDAGYKNMKLVFIVSRKSLVDAEAFCEFIAGNEHLQGIVENNCFEGKQCYKLMEQLERKYIHAASRLRFGYRDEGLIRRITRKLYLPWYSLRYLSGSKP
ncbi:MAG: radical SAM protein [Candidatus Omnitrophica bacterium]|nr:radical SAM protein [Candidatus Omnitrophota bacterium]MBU1925763.1 radical SAM protein [Candidatus Omnitrophota bacterium]